MPINLVGVAEIAQMLGVTRQRVNQMVQTLPDFPVNGHPRVSTGGQLKVSTPKAS